MLPKKKRITKELFNIIMKTGKGTPGAFFTFRHTISPTPHYAVVAPKAVAKGAVLRNKLRRAGYRALSVFPIKSGSGIFFYKKEALKATGEELKTDIEQLLKKAKFL